MTSLLVIQFFFISVLGTLLHFAYDWSKHCFLFSIIGAVNESTWEHLKMGMFPFFFGLSLKLFFPSFQQLFWKFFSSFLFYPFDINNFLFVQTFY